MQIVKRLEEIPSSHELGLILGNFDGVHLGHQFILNQVIKKCHKQGAKTCVITFEPHPLVVLSNHKDFLIMTITQKRKKLEELGIDFLVEMSFTKKMSQLTPEVFLANELFPVRNIGSFFLGYDFRFGAGRTGDFHTVSNFVKNKDINLVQLEKYSSSEKIIPSSTLIRDRLKQGSIHEANILLGSAFKIEGVVTRGDGRGKTIGYPTANLKKSEMNIVPLTGVYKSNSLIKGLSYKSITNIGLNPTFTNGTEVRIETHIMDFNKDIYGEVIELEFLERIRDEMKFNGREELVIQIKKDIDGVYP